MAGCPLADRAQDVWGRFRSCSDWRCCRRHKKRSRAHGLSAGIEQRGAREACIVWDTDGLHAYGVGDMEALMTTRNSGWLT